MKIGQTLYAITHDEDGKAEWETWIIRTIRGGKITAIMKASWTWGKRSTKHGDFGWLPSIPHWCRRTWREGAKPYALHTTKRQAIISETKTYDVENYETPEQAARFLVTLKRLRP